MEDSSSMDWGGGGDGSDRNVSDGEQQMKLQLLARRSPPVVWPGFLTDPRGLGTPALHHIFYL